MTTTTKLVNGILTLTINLNGNAIRFSEADDRIRKVELHNIFCANDKAAKSVASELRAWGVKADTFEGLVMF